ncbi:MAG: NADH-quinone oxidoreductase subunit C [Bacteroidota bacterium]
MFQNSPERNQLVVSKLTDQFSDSIEMNEVIADMLTLTVKKEIIIDVLSCLHSDKDLQFNFLTTLCGMHYPEKDQLGVVYHLHSFTHNHRIRIKTSTTVSEPVIHTSTGIWPAANWMERETYDFYGIRFEGHPNLQRILNMDDMKGFPLRKEFPLEDQTRDDKDDSMFGR